MCCNVSLNTWLLENQIRGLIRSSVMQCVLCKLLELNRTMQSILCNSRADWTCTFTHQQGTECQCLHQKVRFLLIIWDRTKYFPTIIRLSFFGRFSCQAAPLHFEDLNLFPLSNSWWFPSDLCWYNYTRLFPDVNLAWLQGTLHQLSLALNLQSRVVCFIAFWPMQFAHLTW